MVVADSVLWKTAMMRRKDLSGLKVCRGAWVEMAAWIVRRLGSVKMSGSERFCGGRRG